MNHRSLVLVFGVAALLGGCATTRVVDSEVQSFTRSPALARGQGYRFERLPSQQASAQDQTRLEALADKALATAGLVRNDGTARYSVLVGVASAQEQRGSWDDFPHAGPYCCGGWRPFYRYGYGPYPGYGTPSLSVYRHEVTLVLRDLTTQQIVYETRASYEGRGAELLALLPALFEAALKDFPNPPAGVRQIRVTLPL